MMVNADSWLVSVYASGTANCLTIILPRERRVSFKSSSQITPTFRVAYCYRSRSLTETVWLTLARRLHFMWSSLFSSVPLSHTGSFFSVPAEPNVFMFRPRYTNVFVLDADSTESTCLPKGRLMANSTERINKHYHVTGRELCTQ